MFLGISILWAKMKDLILFYWHREKEKKLSRRSCEISCLICLLSLNIWDNIKQKMIELEIFQNACFLLIFFRVGEMFLGISILWAKMKDLILFYWHREKEKKLSRRSCEISCLICLLSLNIWDNIKQKMIELEIFQKFLLIFFFTEGWRDVLGHFDFMG